MEIIRQSPAEWAITNYLHGIYSRPCALPALLLVYILTMGIPVFSQGNYRLDFKNDSALQQSFAAKKFGSRQAMQSAISAEYNNIISEGFFDASFDTLFIDPVLTVIIERHEQKTLQLQQQNTKSEVDSSQKIVVNITVNELAEFPEQELIRFENNGYPFASLLYKTERYGDTLTFSLENQPGPFFTFDSLIVKGGKKLPEKFIRNYLTFKKGSPYNESWVAGLDTKLREIPFLKSIRGAEVVFHEKTSDCYLYLSKKGANYFNGILGIQPNETTGKTNITGDLEVKLLNSLNTGDEIFLEWRKLQPQTQDLSVHLMLPFILGLPVGTEGKLNIFRRDSTFTNFKTSLSLLHLMGGNNRIKVFVEKIATNQLSSFSTAGTFANVNSTLYGVGGRFEKLDYRFNPRKGYHIVLEAAAGKKNARPGNIEEGIEASYEILRLEGEAGFFIPTWKRQTLYFGGIAAALFSPVLYTTEMYRFGGLKTLRGLDEESLFASAFARGTIEYRYLIDINSSLFLFADQGWYERKEPGLFETDTPLGFGTGINFETKAGIFLFTYALGQQFDNPILLRSGKVSFGFRNIF